MSDEKFIAVVDDEPELRELIASFFETSGFNVFLIPSVGAAFAFKHWNLVSVALVDYIFDPSVQGFREALAGTTKGTGIEVLEYLKRYHPKVTRVLLTGSHKLGARPNPAADVVVGKPVSPSALLTLVSELSDGWTK